jgi:hypothetical protein
MRGGALQREASFLGGCRPLMRDWDLVAGRTAPHPSGSWSSRKNCTRLTTPPSCNVQLPESLSSLAGRGATHRRWAPCDDRETHVGPRGRVGATNPSASPRLGPVTGNRRWRRQRGHSLRRALVCCPSPRRRGEGGQRPDEGLCLATVSELSGRMPGVDARREIIVGARPLTPSGSWSSDKCCPSFRPSRSCHAQLPNIPLPACGERGNNPPAVDAPVGTSRRA